MTDENVVRLNPDAEALLGLTAAISNMTQSLAIIGQIVVTKDLDEDFKAEVKATAEAMMKRFRNEIETGMTTVVSFNKRASVFPAFDVKQ
jgi:hypothetical protein